MSGYTAAEGSRAVLSGSTVTKSLMAHSPELRRVLHSALSSQKSVQISSVPRVRYTRSIETLEEVALRTHVIIPRSSIPNVIIISSLKKKTIYNFIAIFK